MGVCRLSFHVAILVNGVTVGGRSHQAVVLPLRCVCALDEEPVLCCVIGIRALRCVALLTLRLLCSDLLWGCSCPVACGTLGGEATVLMLVAH